MFNHGRSRQPRRRDFDSDFTFDRAPPGNEVRYPSSRPSSPTAFGPEADATVKWFNPEKGFGFVEMRNDDEARHAIAALHGAEAEGRRLTVNVAQPRADRGGRR